MILDGSATEANSSPAYAIDLCQPPGHSRRPKWKRTSRLSDCIDARKLQKPSARP